MQTTQSATPSRSRPVYPYPYPYPYIAAYDGKGDCNEASNLQSRRASRRGADPELGRVRLLPSLCPSLALKQAACRSLALQLQQRGAISNTFHLCLIVLYRWHIFTAMTPAQCRAARATLNWSAERLASAASVSLSTIRNFERGASVPIANNLSAMRRALEDAGVIFIPSNGEGPGVRERKDGAGSSAP